MSMLCLPRVIVNFAITADGKVSTRNWTPSGFGSTRDRKRLQEIRARGDAVMVGRKTAEIDCMVMGISQPTLRKARTLADKPAEPLRVVISGRGKLDPNMKIFSSMRSPLLIFTKNSHPLQQTLPQGVKIHPLGEEFSLKRILNILNSQYEVQTLVCEGGPALMRALLEADLVTELNLTITPLIFGGHEAPSLSGCPGKFLPRPVDFKLKSMDVSGEECFLVYERRRKQGKTPDRQPAGNNS